MLQPEVARPLARLLVAAFLFAPAGPVAAGASSVAMLHWTATGDDGSVGRATRYDIRRSLAPITPANFFLCDTVGGAPLPATAGTPQSCPVIMPVTGMTYYFALRVVDEHGNWSQVSNVASYNVPVTSGSEPALQARAFAPPWPNPARGRAMFRIATPTAEDADVSIYDPSGRLVRTLWKGPLQSGRHTIEWDLRDERASPVAPGIYFARVRLGDWIRVRNLVVTR